MLKSNNRPNAKSTCGKIANKVTIMPFHLPNNLIDIYEIVCITEAPGNIFVTITISSNSSNVIQLFLSTISFLITGINAFPPPKPIKVILIINQNNFQKLISFLSFIFSPYKNY
ncbi:Uncharacterised protein [Mycoplasmopsis edwardii]|uniref:Uncharacterized protein n=1 Tax=Mycoplasmopsis edwardii TaxID=53558 RepID=A0A3B0PKK2_9BACT|nr:Uncharacterised protein [Mycoplasmopsis edwardii]